MLRQTENSLRLIYGIFSLVMTVAERAKVTSCLVNE